MTNEKIVCMMHVHRL